MCVPDFFLHQRPLARDSDSPKSRIQIENMLTEEYAPVMLAGFRLHGYLLYVQEVVTLQEKIFYKFVSENEVYTIY